MRLRAAAGFALLAVCLCLCSAAPAADKLRIAIQKNGTVAWEIMVMKALGLDKAADLDIETTELASTEAGKIALRGGAADMIVSDWLWVARERSLGDKLLFAPYSNALGAFMTAKDKPIHSLADLNGRSLGVAGGPLDKSWLLAQAAARKQGHDLARSVPVAYGAPPLVAEKLADGELDAALEFWNFCVDLESRGFRRAIEMSDIEKALGAKGPVAMTGYVFTERFARERAGALKRYLAAVAKARQALAQDPSAWAPIKARLNVPDEAFEIYRSRYVEGLPKRPISEEAADAAALYQAILDAGGKDLVGDAPELDKALFFDPNAAF
ncbi:MAG TPA: ABC transporter substrate-binding protein [Roseiarcus sp.]|nr:ABC transporter substrate-binding protein [Roseiarcus sp.]